MRPRPNGSIFLQDYGFASALLAEIEAQADALELTDSDREMLARYRTTADKLQRDFEPLYREASEKLREAGFTVIPTPGVFYDVSATELEPEHPERVMTNNVNFLNAITGWSEKEDANFYFASGANAGDKLGGILMHAFRDFMRQYAGTQVHFIGHDPSNPEDFGEAMRWLNTGRAAGSALPELCASHRFE